MLKRAAENRERKPAGCAPGTATSGGVCSRGQGAKPRQHWRSGQKKYQYVRVGGVIRRARRETAPTLAFRAKKIPIDKGWDFGKWWWNTELNLKPLFKHLPPVCRRLHNSPNKGFVLRSFGRRHKGTQIRSHIELTRPHDLDSWICNHFIPMRNPTSSTCHCKLRRKHR